MRRGFVGVREEILVPGELKPSYVYETSGFLVLPDHAEFPALVGVVSPYRRNDDIQIVGPVFHNQT